MNETLIKHTPIFDLVTKHDKDGVIGFDPVGINAPDWITIVVEQDGKFLMTNQLRYGLMHECEEFCAGQVDKGESPIATARRELAEETGIYVKSLVDVVYLGKFAANPAFMSNHMHYFYVNLNDSEYTIVDTHMDEHEKVVSYWKNKSDVVSDCMKNHDSVFMPAALFLMIKNGIQL